MQAEHLRNWAGNLTYAGSLRRPGSADEVTALVAKSEPVKALGTRHSFTDVGDSSGLLISLERLNRVISLDRDRRTVTVEAGIRYGELCQFLDREGWALQNMASLPHISVGGACATGTHGSGVGNGSLSTEVSAMDVVLADGSLAHFSRADNSDEFDGMVVHLGTLGVVVGLTLNVRPAFQVAQTVYESLPIEGLEERFLEIMSAGYSVSLFTKWGGCAIDQVWVKRESDRQAPAGDFFGAKSADGPRHPLPDGPARNCTDQMGVPGPWHLRLPHFRLEHMPSSGDELQSEYFVPLDRGFEAIRALWPLGVRINPHLHVSEIRTVARDRLWLSPCYERDSLAIHFTWKKQPDAVMALLPQIEATLEPFEAKPHWAKLFATSPERLEKLHERLSDFRSLRSRLDPSEKFGNGFVHRCGL